MEIIYFIKQLKMTRPKFVKLNEFKDDYLKMCLKKTLLEYIKDKI